MKFASSFYGEHRNIEFCYGYLRHLDRYGALLVVHQDDGTTMRLQVLEQSAEPRAWKTWGSAERAKRGAELEIDRLYLSADCPFPASIVELDRAERELSEAEREDEGSEHEARHAAHCCHVHGCKYGQDGLCPVVIGGKTKREPGAPGWCQEPGLVSDPGACT